MLKVNVHCKQMFGLTSADGILVFLWCFYISQSKKKGKRKFKYSQLLHLIKTSCKSAEFPLHIHMDFHLRSYYDNLNSTIHKISLWTFCKYLYWIIVQTDFSQSSLKAQNISIADHPTTFPSSLTQDRSSSSDKHNFTVYCFGLSLRAALQEFSHRTSTSKQRWIKIQKGEPVKVIIYLLIQKRFPVGGGPSSKTWPRWASHTAQRTSWRGIKIIDKSNFDFTLFPIGW